MKDIEKLFWFIGLFEGEGSFSMTKRYARWVTITSTDLDVLERVTELFGGKIITPKLRNEKWKQEYVWYTTKDNSKKIIDSIFPYLCKRRQERALDWLKLYSENVLIRDEKILKISTNLERIKELRSLGYTHEKIAKEIGCDRSHISKILKKSLSNQSN